MLWNPDFIYHSCITADPNMTSQRKPVAITMPVLLFAGAFPSGKTLPSARYPYSTNVENIVVKYAGQKNVAVANLTVLLLEDCSPFQTHYASTIDAVQPQAAISTIILRKL